MTESLKYSIKQHARAKHIKIKVSGLGKIEVVIPPGVGPDEAHKFVKKNTAWIHKTLEKLDDDRINHPDLGFDPPQSINFHALSKNYVVSYFSDGKDQKKPYIIEGDFELQIYTPSKAESVKLLRSWHQKKAKQHLIPWLQSASLQHKIEFNKVSIRGQKTRWGSCSSQKNINLNRNLLFLDSSLVNYLLVHELSHIIQPNHSKQFWQQVAKLEPDYQKLDSELSQSHKKIPLWAYA